MYNSCSELFISILSYIHSCCTAQCVACQKLPTLGDHFSFIFALFICNFTFSCMYDVRDYVYLCVRSLGCGKHFIPYTPYVEMTKINLNNEISFENL